MSRRLTPLLALLALAACSPAHAPAPKPAELTFSILSSESKQSGEADWAPFLNDMGAALGVKVKPFYASNYMSLIEAMRFRQTDLGYFSNQSGLEAVRRAGGQVFAHTVSAGAGGYQSIIVAKRGSGVTLERLLKCDRTLDFGMGDASSTSGTLAPTVFLFGPRKIEPATCFKTVRSADHEANLFAVGHGLLGAATNNNISLQRLSLNASPDARRLAGQLEVIWTSPTLPEDPLVWRKDLDPALRRKIAAFVYGYGVGPTPEAARQRAVLAHLQTAPFVAADDRHLVPVRQMEATEHLIEARRKGDATGAAKAQAALDQVNREAASPPSSAGSAP